MNQLYYTVLLVLVEVSRFMYNQQSILHQILPFDKVPTYLKVRVHDIQDGYFGSRPDPHFFFRIQIRIFLCGTDTLTESEGN